MTLRIDPERNEIRALQQMADWRGKHVLEIGCGSGRLTRRLAALAPKVDALDPDKMMIALARKELPARYSERVKFKVGSAANLKYRDQTFHIAVFSWVL